MKIKQKRFRMTSFHSMDSLLDRILYSEQAYILLHWPTHTAGNWTTVQTIVSQEIPTRTTFQTWPITYVANQSGVYFAPPRHLELALKAGLWSRRPEPRAGARSRSPSNFRWLEPESKNFRWWSRSLKFGFRFKRVIKIIQCFFCFWTKLFWSRARAKHLKIWSRSQKNWMPGFGVGAWNLSIGSTALVKGLITSVKRCGNVIPTRSHPTRILVVGKIMHLCSFGLNLFLKKCACGFLYKLKP